MKDRRFLWLATVPAALGGLAALLLTVFGPPGGLRRLVVFGDWAGLLLGAGVLRRGVGKLGRDLDQCLVDQHGHRVEARGVGLQPQALRLQRDGAAALQERQEAWRMRGVSVSYPMQSKQLEGVRSFDPEIAFLRFSSCQQALRRLDTRHQIIRQVLGYQGRVDTSLVRVAEVFREAVRENAPAIVVCHNHPSGAPGASPQDVAVTKEIATLTFAYSK